MGRPNIHIRVNLFEREGFEEEAAIEQQLLVLCHVFVQHDVLVDLSHRTLLHRRLKIQPLRNSDKPFRPFSTICPRQINSWNESQVDF